MKRYLISAVVVLTVLAMTLVVLGQEAAERPRGAARGGFRNVEAQQKAVAAIEQQIAKLKAGLEAPATPPAGGQELSEEERAKMRERFTKIREEQQQSIAAIEQQIMILKGRRQLQQEHDASIADLKELQTLATKEKAAETTKRIEELIAKRTKAFEDNMQKLGLPEMPMRGQGQAGERGPRQGQAQGQAPAEKPAPKPEQKPKQP